LLDLLLSAALLSFKWPVRFSFRTETFMDFSSVVLALQTLVLVDVISLILVICGESTNYETRNILILLSDPLFLS